MPRLNTLKTIEKTTNNQGNALIIVLVLIALLAALTAVAMRSSNRSTGNLDTETARIGAEKLMRQAKGFESAINQLTTVNQCSENEISFENGLTTRNYTNASSPVSKECFLFNSAGAGLNYSNPQSSTLDSTLSAKSDYGQWVFTGSHCILGIGSDDDDTCTDTELALIAIVPHMNISTCLQINTMNGITNPAGAPPEDVLAETAATFVGTFATAADPEIGEGVTGIELVKHSTGCFKNTSGAWTNSYIFYHILIAR